MGNGERRAFFEQLYRQHHRAVLGYAARRSSFDVAQDVASETFAVAWRRADDIPDDTLPWLLAVARRVLANQRRQDRRRDALVTKITGALQPGAAATPDHAHAVCERDATNAALARLPEADRELLTLIAWDCLNPAQAARVLGTPPGTVRVRLHRARRRFRSALDEIEHAADSGIHAGVTGHHLMPEEEGM